MTPKKHTASDSLQRIHTYKIDQVTVTWSPPALAANTGARTATNMGPANTDRDEGLRRQNQGLCPWHDRPDFGCEPCADLIEMKS